MGCRASGNQQGNVVASLRSAAHGTRLGRLITDY